MVSIWYLIIMYVGVIILGAIGIGVVLFLQNYFDSRNTYNKFQTKPSRIDDTNMALNVGVYFLVTMVITLVLFGLYF